MSFRRRFASVRPAKFFEHLESRLLFTATSLGAISKISSIKITGTVIDSASAGDRFGITANTILAFSALGATSPLAAGPPMTLHNSHFSPGT
jgi:hypothetical protein